MKDWNADGHLVDTNHKCSQCGAPMPLPESEGKHCTKCGKREPTHEERMEEIRQATEKKCRACLHITKNPNVKFCELCGRPL